MITPKLKSIAFSEGQIHAHFVDGRVISCPLHWFPRLENASEEARLSYKISQGGLGAHWPSLDEDLSAQGFFTFVPKSLSV